jgi:AraC-like DNA-binding protein
MNILADANLSKHHCLLSSNSTTETRVKVSQYLWPHQMTIKGKKALNSQLRGVFFGKSALLDLCYGADVRINAGEINDYYLIRTTLRGSGNVTFGKQQAAMQNHRLTITSPIADSVVDMDNECRNLILRISRDCVQRQLQQMLDRNVQQPLVFNVSVDGAAPILHTFNYICQLYKNSDAAALQQLNEQFSDYLVSLLISQLPHNYSEELQHGGKNLSPSHVKRAIEYIEEHYENPIALSSLAMAAGVSIRTLQNSFKRFTDQTPSNFIRNLRLKKVHEALKSSEGGATVCDILVRHGISSFGHFAKQYRSRFGCLPSETAKKHLR